MSGLRKLSDAVPLAPVLEAIGEKRQHYRAERIARFGWPETISCPACGDTGTNPDAPQNACLCPAGDRLTAMARRRAMWDDRIPRAMRPWRLSTAPDQTAAADVRRWLRDGRLEDGTWPNLILRGEPGAGKSGLAVAALYTICGQDRSVAFHVVADYLDSQRPCPKDDHICERRQAATMRQAQRVAMLAFDDVGAERMTEFALEQTYMVLNHRMNEGLPTIVTTNLPHDALADVLGARLLRRVTQDGAAWEVVVRKY